MAALINQVIGENVVSDLDGLIKKLVSVEKQFDIINSKNINVGNISSLSDYTILVKKHEDTLKELAKTKQQYADLSTKIAQKEIEEADKLAQKVLANELRKIEAREKAVDRSIAGMQKEQAARSKQIEKEQADSDKIAAKVLANELKKAEASQKYTAELQKRADAAQKLADKEQARLSKEQEAYSKLSKEYNAAAREAQNLGAEQYRLQQAVKAGTNVQVNNTALFDLAPRLKAATEKAGGLHKALLDIDQTVGRSQRNVGNYNGAVFALSQVLREAPSFAYSFSTGLMGISNNIPILVDEITRLKEANAALKASGQESVPIWKTLGASLFTFNNLITIGIAVVTIFAARMAMAKNEAGSAASELEKYNKQLEDLKINQDAVDQKSNASSSFEAGKAESLADIMTNKALGIEANVDAYNKLKAIMPGVLHNYTQEQALAGQATKDIYAQIKARTDLIAKISENEQVLKQELDLHEKTKKMYKEAVSQYGVKSAKDIDPTIVKNMNEQLNSIVNRKILLDKMRSDLALLNSPDIPEKKEKKKKDNAKNLEAELAAEEAHYKIRQEQDEAEYNRSNRTFYESKIFEERKKEAAMEHAREMLDIIDNYHGKVGESEAKFTARKAQVVADQMAIDNAANENERKIAEEIQKRHNEEEKRSNEWLERMRAQRAELEKTERAIEAIQKKGQIDHEAAGGMNGYLSAFGYSTKFATDHDKRQVDIEGHNNNIDSLKDEQAPFIGKDLGKVMDFDQKIANERKSIAQLEVDDQRAKDELILRSKKETSDSAVELAKTAIDNIRQMQEQQFAWEQENINRQMEQVRFQSEQKMRAIDASTGFAIQKDNQRALVAAQTQAAENELQRKSNELALKKAQFEKQAAELSIIANTAAAIVKTIAAYAGIPGGFAIAAPIIAIEAAIGAAQYAAAASAPLPQFEKGGTTSTPYFVAGEKGKELITTPSGKMMLTPDIATIMTAPIGSKVTRHEDTMKMINFASQSIGMSAGSISALQDKQQQIMTDKKIVAELQELRQDVINAAMIGRVIKNNVTVNLNNDLQRK